MASDRPCILFRDQDGIGYYCVLDGLEVTVCTYMRLTSMSLRVSESSTVNQGFIRKLAVERPPKASMLSVL